MLVMMPCRQTWTRLRTLVFRESDCFSLTFQFVFQASRIHRIFFNVILFSDSEHVHIFIKLGSGLC